LGGATRRACLFARCLTRAVVRSTRLLCQAIEIRCHLAFAIWPEKPASLDKTIERRANLFAVEITSVFFRTIQEVVAIIVIGSVDSAAATVIIAVSAAEWSRSKHKD
jgi:hypothetical protein